MKKFISLAAAIIAFLVLASCTNDQTLTKEQQCDQIQRQIAMNKQIGSSGYSTWDMAQYKISQLQQQARSLGC